MGPGGIFGATLVAVAFVLPSLLMLLALAALYLELGGLPMDAGSVLWDRCGGDRGSGGAHTGAFVFGSGLAIVPFLYGGVVGKFQWLTERQFLDAVAVAMITPGPVVITVAFIGHLVAGPLGATVAALGVFLPCYLLVVIPAP
jgi:chromate transport protein ChrA